VVKARKKRKKTRSRKQKANDKRLGRMAKARARPKRRKTTSKRRKKPKTRKKNKSTKPRKKSMTKGGIRSKLNSPLIKKVLMASGLATIAVSVASIVLPSQAQLLNSPVVKAGIGFVVGDIPGALTNFLLAGGAGNVIGGSGGSGSNAGSNGFA